jgi:GTPase
MVATMKSGIVTIVGRPNSGKSTLLNALVGQRISIVSDKPQTTRHRIIGIVNDPAGQIVFADTPGIHKPAYRMNERMQHVVQEAMDGVDLLLHMVDASVAFGAGERHALDMVKASGRKSLLLLNKTDRMEKQRLLPIIDRYARESVYEEIIPISALTGDNLQVVRKAVIERLPEGPALYAEDDLTDRNERFLSAEFVREKILQKTREELPYVTAVLIRKFDEAERQSKKLVRIEADILVEKRSQQGIVVGAGGSMLKEIGTTARKDLEVLLGCRVFLALTVRTVPSWRNQESVLDELELGR